MAEKAKEKRPQLKRNVSVAVVLMLAAAMFSISAKLNYGSEKRHPEDLVSLVRVEAKRNQELVVTTEALQSQIDEYTERQNSAIPSLPKDEELATQVGSGSAPVTGPGIRVALSDAPTGLEVPQGLTVDDLVVHQQDLQAVINALWAGGAEAMTLQGQRVTPMTAFKCVGNVLLLHGQVFSPPYVVEAIGDPNSLNQALNDSEAIDIYKQYVAAVGLGWEADTKDKLHLPAASNTSSLKYAKVPDGTDIWK